MSMFERVSSGEQLVFRFDLPTPATMRRLSEASVSIPRPRLARKAPIATRVAAVEDGAWVTAGEAAFGILSRLKVVR